MLGETLHGRYQIVRLVGEGGMGSVYEAKHIETGQRVAVKMIIPEKASGGLIKRFSREARAAGSLDTPHIVKVMDTGVEPGTQRAYMVMEYLEGEDLQRMMDRVGPISPDAALRIAAQACLGLQEAHNARIVHRDIKPANLFLVHGPNDEVTVKLVDFGIAKLWADELDSAETAGLTRTGALLGSPLYMSPEQARGFKNIDQRADVWSLGMVVYHLVAGRTAWHEIEALGELIYAICTRLPPSVQDFAPWVSPEAASVIHRALLYDTAARFQTAGDMLDAIKPLLPNGMALKREMLTRINPTLRTMVAPRMMAMPFSGTRPSNPSMTQLAGPLPSSIQVTTDEGVSTNRSASDIAVGRRTPRRLFVGGALVCMIAGGVLAYRWSKAAESSRTPTDGEAAAATVPSTEPARAPAPTATPVSVAEEANPVPPEPPSGLAAESKPAVKEKRETPPPSKPRPAPPRTSDPSSTSGSKSSATPKPVDTQAFGDRK